MADEIKQTAKETKAKKPVQSAEVKAEVKPTVETPKTEVTDVKAETKPAAKPEVKKVKRDVATAQGVSLWVSKKQSMYICSFIKGKKIDEAIADLEQVEKKRKVVPFKGEIPHRKGPGMMSGRWPVKAAGLFIQLLKGLKGNALTFGMDLDRTRITQGVSNWASRPRRSGGRKFKRTHIILTAREEKK